MAILTPKELINAVEGFYDESNQIQPAGYDLTVKIIEKFEGEGLLAVSNDNRKLPETTPVSFNDHGQSNLSPGAYIVRYNERVNVPLNAAGYIVPRSSLMRSGATLHSALWDPGYQGYGMGLLTVFNDIKIQKNARIGQLVFFELKNMVNTGYEGTYQREGIKNSDE